MPAEAPPCDGSVDGRVLFVTSEISDFVKVGGLGEVSAALPRALNRFVDVRVLIPGYREIVRGRSTIETVGKLSGLRSIPACTLGRLVASDGLIVYVLICPELFERAGTPYTDEDGEPWFDSDLRFARLSLAAAQIAGGAGESKWKPTILHLNDWPAAMAAGYIEWLGLKTPSILTIHNLAFQGLFPPDKLDALGIPDAAFNLNGIEFHGNLSFLKAGIYYASHVTTVSKTYAREITQSEFGCGLHGLLAARAREGKLSGILNGIDDSWEFALGVESPAPTDQDAWKEIHAVALRKDFGLGVSRGPLFAIVSRLVHQKGVDLSIEAAEDIIEAGGQIVAVGTGERRLEEAVLALQRRRPDAVGVNIGFDDAQARKIFAGSDFLLMPSRFEPCGLSQMYAQKFGSLPIAHRTGGLADTIEDGATGFLFSGLNSGGLAFAVKRALATFASKHHITKMRLEAMSRDFTWGRSVNSYIGLYHSMR